MLQYFLLLVSLSSLLTSCYTLKSQMEFSEGRRYLESGNYCEAENCLKRAIELDKKNADYHLNLSYTYTSLGKIDRAWYEARQAVLYDLNILTLDNFAKIYDYYQKHESFIEGETTLLEVLDILGCPDISFLISDSDVIFLYGNILLLKFKNNRIIKIENGCLCPRLQSEFPDMKSLAFQVPLQEERFMDSLELFSIAVPHMMGSVSIKEIHTAEGNSATFRTNWGDLFRIEIYELPSETYSAIFLGNQTRRFLEYSFENAVVREFKKNRKETKILFQDFLKKSNRDDFLFGFLCIPTIGEEERIDDLHVGYLLFLEGTRLVILCAHVPVIERSYLPPTIQTERVLKTLIQAKKSYRNENKKVSI